MNKFFKSLSILVLFFILVTGESFAASSTANNDGQEYIPNSGPKVAKVIVARAVVYADETLLTPLGYIPNGKLINVGAPRRVNHDIVPTIISGRIAYIELKDIEYQDEKLDEKNAKNGYLKEHNVDIVLVKPEEKLNENNSIYFQVGRYDGGQNLHQVIYDLEGTDASWLTTLGTFFLHRKPMSRYFWGAGFEYGFVKSSQMSFQNFMVFPTFGYTFMRNVAFSVEAFVNADISTSTSFNIDNNFADDPSGFVWGPQIGVRFLTTPTTKYRLFGSLSYRIYNAYNLTTLKKTDPNDPVVDINVPGLDNMKGFSLNFGIGFDI